MSYRTALNIAYLAHDGQYRKESCVPYVVHPLRVSQCFTDDLRKTVAILHDVVEDTDVTLEELAECFSTSVISALDSITKRKNETHFEYILRCKRNEIAKEIKIADIVDNLSDTLCVQPISMIERYNKSLKLLLT